MASADTRNAEIAAQLRDFVRAQTEDPSADVAEIEPLPGHAGFSYSFILERRSAGQSRTEKLALRLAPPNVRASGPAFKLEPTRRTSSRMRPRRPPMDEQSVPKGPRQRVDRLADRCDLGRPRMALPFSDPDSWVGGDLVPKLIPTPDGIIDIYAQFAGVPVSPAEVRWFRAFAGYRFGVITAFNLMLHRRGKRHDPMWEDIALSAPRLFEHGLELIS